MRRERVQSFDALAQFQGWGHTVGEAGETERVESMRVTPSFFRLLRAEPLRGRLFTEQPAAISHVTCEGRIRNGFAGELRASVLETRGVCLELDSVLCRAHLIAEGLNVKLDGRGGRIQVGTLTLQEAQVTMSELVIRVGSITVSGLKVAWDEGRVRIEAIKAKRPGYVGRIEAASPATGLATLGDVSLEYRPTPRLTWPQLARGSGPVRVLNLFGYTGGSTLAAAVVRKVPPRKPAIKV